MQKRYLIHTFFITTLLLVTYHGISQNYAVSLIPDSLKEEAHSVTRNYQMQITMKDPTHITVQYQWAVTVLNKDGENDAYFRSYYSKLYSVDDIEGNLYDAEGNKLKTVKKKDIEDHALDGDGSLIADDRYKEHVFNYQQYPYTVSYTYTQEFKSIFLVPSWAPLSYDNALQYATLDIKVPANYELRLKGLNVKELSAWQQQGEAKSFKFEIKNIKAISAEYLSPISIINNFPKILIAGTNVTLDKYNGNIATWKDMGSFIYSLYMGRDQLPENIKKEVHSLTDTISSQREKVAVLYKYLQNSTRYVSIQLGIGGWQPFPAAEVASKKYGDCKALSNYMFSLLKEAGITSNPVIINAGGNHTDYIPKDFPDNYFNHVILCVPQSNDTIWLECTSQNNPFDYMSSFSANRKALLISPEGGSLVSTPQYSPMQNLQKRITLAKLDTDGNMKAEMNTIYNGEQQDNISALLHDVSEDRRKRYLNTMFDLPTYEVTNSFYKEDKKQIPCVTESLSITAPNFATTMGKRILFAPNAFNISDRKLDTLTKRQADIIFPYAFYDTDSTIYDLPIEYEAESIPKDQEISAFFGKYTIHFKYEPGKLTCIRTQERTAGRFPPEQYPEVVKYFDAIYKADRGKIVLKKKE